MTAINFNSAEEVYSNLGGFNESMPSGIYLKNVGQISSGAHVNMHVRNLTTYANFGEAEEISPNRLNVVENGTLASVRLQAPQPGPMSEVSFVSLNFSFYHEDETPLTLEAYFLSFHDFDLGSTNVQVGCTASAL